jgi:hypothetical protein
MNTTLPLRLTYNEADITFYILNEKPSVAEQDITISVKGQTYQLTKNMGRWKAQNEALPETNMLSAIGDSIALRYRI